MRLAGLLLFLTVLCGCSKPSVVGKWTTTVPNFNIPMTVEFTSDGKMLANAEMSAGSRKIKIEQTATYKVDETADEPTLTVDVTSTKADGKPLTVPAATLHQSGKIKFGKDSFTFTTTVGSMSQTQEFTRVVDAK